jgi:hypothetical protein
VFVDAGYGVALNPHVGCQGTVQVRVRGTEKANGQNWVLIKYNSGRAVVNALVEDVTIETNGRRDAFVVVRHRCHAVFLDGIAIVVYTTPDEVGLVVEPGASGRFVETAFEAVTGHSGGDRVIAEELATAGPDLLKERQQLFYVTIVVAGLAAVAVDVADIAHNDIVVRRRHVGNGVCNMVVGHNHGGWARYAVDVGCNEATIFGPGARSGANVEDPVPLLDDIEAALDLIEFGPGLRAEASR